MDKIEWSDSFSVGVKLFDDQHKTIIGMINRLIEAPNIDTNSAIITDLLTGMIEYAT
jgi:hemerythrin